MATTKAKLARPQVSPRSSALYIGGANIKPTSRSFVVPAVPTDDHWLSLSNLDRIVNPTFSSVILFYEKIVDESRSFHDVCQCLKESLSKTLVHFFPLAGRLALRKDGLVDVHCTDEGAIFLEARVDADLSSVGGAKPNHALSGLQLARLGPGPNFVPDQIRTIPALVVMVTVFKCGSIAVGTNWHHTVADGSSGCHFLKSWAEVASGGCASLVPNHDRWLLRARDTPDPSLVNGYSTRNIETELEEHWDDDCTETKISQLPTEPPILGSFYISKTAIQSLKEEVSKESEDGGQFTSALSMSAYLWQNMTKARVKTHAKDEDIHLRSESDTRFFMFVDGRKSLKLPAGYFGNVVCSACAVASEEDIMTKPLAYAASLIKSATKAVSADYFRSLIDWAEIQGSSPSKSEHVNSVGHDVAATFWTFFPLYEVNFGWGKPKLAARNSCARPLIDGIAVMPTARPGDMMALLNLHSDRMDKLKDQDSFLQKFSCLSTS